MTAQLTHRAAEPLGVSKEPFVDIHRSGRIAIVACVALFIALSGAPHRWRKALGAGAGNRA